MKMSQLLALLSLSAMTAASSAHAGVITYLGRFTLDNTSSIPGAPKGDSFDFRLTLDDNATDLDHSFFENGVGGLTFDGQYQGAVHAFSMKRVPSNSGDWDPSTLSYDLANSVLLTTDVNVPPGLDPVEPPMNEHLTIDIPVSTVGAPVRRVYFNLYNIWLD